MYRLINAKNRAIAQQSKTVVRAFFYPQYDELHDKLDKHQLRDAKWGNKRAVHSLYSRGLYTHVADVTVNHTEKKSLTEKLDCVFALMQNDDELPWMQKTHQGVHPLVIQHLISGHNYNWRSASVW